MELFYLFAYASVIALTNEISARQGIGIFKWVIGNFAGLVLNILIHAGFLLIFASISGSILFSGIICCAVFYALVNVSFFKYAARNEVLYASDFLLFFKVMSVSDKSNLFITKYNIVALLLNILFLVPAALNIFTLDAAYRLVFSFFGLAAIFIVCILIKRNNDNDFTYFKKGFSLGLLSNIYLYFTEDMTEPVKPENKTSEKAVVYEQKSTPEIKPNVIMLLSESFWDIEKISGLHFSEKILPNFRKLTENSSHGSLIVTPFGGGTCNVESEVLTGTPVRYFNMSNSFYHRYISRQILSLPGIFADNGYETVALHTFDKNFYNRDVALSYMGFNDFKAKEDLVNPAYKGTYIADSELTKMIIQAYENKSKPAFIFGISMENHQPYGKDKYSNNPIKLMNGEIDQNLRNIAEAYAHGLRDADDELAALVRYFENVKEPTDIIFFGDHLGALGPLFSLYRKMGYISQSNQLSLSDIKNIYSTEFIIWSNYKSTKNYYPDTGSNFLGNIVLNHLGFEKPEFYYFMDDVYEKWHSINRNDLFIDKYGKMYNCLPDEFRIMDEHYRHLSRRIILG